MAYLFSLMFGILGFITFFTKVKTMTNMDIIAVAALFGVAALFRISWFLEVSKKK